MSSSDNSDNEDNAGPTFEVIYPVGEETEVPNTKGQLFKTVLVEGTGSKPPRGSKVTVSYKGTLASDGTVFDSSDTFDFTIGAGQVIKGWDQGVATMRKGERATLKCLPEYAYGKAGSPPTIPPNATLNFEVEVKDWTKSEDISEKKDRSIMKKVEVEGRHYGTPEYETELKADVNVFTGSEDEENKAEVFRCHDWQIIIGETVLPSGLEVALCSMKEGEEATVVVKGSHVAAAPEFGIATAGVTVTYEIKMHAFQTIKTWTFQGSDKVAEGLKRKDAGNEYFKKGDWVRAEKKYRRAVEFVENDHGLDDAQKAECIKIKVAALSNLAQVLINTKRYLEAVSECDKVLIADGGNIKALFRRGKAYNLLDEWSDATNDLKKVLDMDPGNADAARELDVVRQKIRQHDQQEKAKFGNLFSKLAAMEEKEHKKSA